MEIGGPSCHKSERDIRCTKEMLAPLNVSMPEEKDILGDDVFLHESGLRTAAMLEVQQHSRRLPHRHLGVRGTCTSDSKVVQAPLDDY